MKSELLLKKKAKNNKPPGEDKVINEYAANSVDSMIYVYVKLFNLIFDTHIFILLKVCCHAGFETLNAHFLNMN